MFNLAMNNTFMLRQGGDNTRAWWSLSICLQETSLALGTAHEQTQTLLAQTIIANSLPHIEAARRTFRARFPPKVTIQ